MNRRMWWMTGLAALLCAQPALAQFAPNAQPMFGGRMINSGFMPDPVLFNGQAGGQVPASNINPSCRGYISPQPSHVISSRSGFQLVRFVVSSPQDTTLMVMLPNGQLVCDDDGGEGNNPLVEMGSPPGEIRVWVGAYSPSYVGAPYTLGVSELPQVTASNLQGGPGPIVVQPPPQMGGGIAPQMPPAFGAVALRTGFMPDPQVMAGTAGGPVEAASVDGSCRGWITPQPSHAINTPTGFRNLRVVVNSGGMDTTLVVQTADGRIYCNDDGGGGLNPMVDAMSPPGTVRVWVGAYARGQSGSYNVGFSELGVTSANLPPPGGGQVVVQPPIVQPPIVQPPIVQPPPADVVQMQLMIPVTLFGPGMDPGTVAMWAPRGASPVQVTMRGQDILAGGQSLGSIPPGMQDAVVTVTARRDGSLLVRCEQPPGPGDAGQQFLLLVQNNGAPSVVERWTGNFRQRAPRWAR